MVMSSANVNSAKAFLAAVDELILLKKQWIGWAPTCLQDVEDPHFHSPLYQQWRALTQDLEANDPNRWSDWEKKCTSASNRAASISKGLTSNARDAIQFVKANGGDSKSMQVHKWFSDQTKQLTNGPWDYATPDKVRSFQLDPHRDFQEIFYPEVPEIDLEVRGMIDYAIMLAEPTDHGSELDGLEDGFHPSVGANPEKFVLAKTDGRSGGAAAKVESMQRTPEAAQPDDSDVFQSPSADVHRSQAKQPVSQLERIAFDDETLTVTLDDKPYRIGDVAGYGIVKYLHQQQGHLCNGDHLRQNVRGLKGKNAVGDKLKALPEPIGACVVGTRGRGYHFVLPAAQQEKVKRRD